MAVIDVAGFVADLKDHAVEHRFHVHDERHFVDSYSLRQNWEVDLHPEEGCEGPVDLYLSLEIDPRVLLGFEDAVIERADVEGVIATEARGDGGFGYDPLFVPVEGDGRTFAEMSAAEKHRVSHRGRAFRTLADGLKVVEALEQES